MTVMVCAGCRALDNGASIGYSVCVVGNQANRQAPKGASEYTMTSRSQEIVSAVRAWNARTGQGCPLFVLRGKYDFDAEDIKKASARTENNPHGENAVQAVRGKTGGFWPFGEVPESHAGDPSLKAEMAAFLQRIVNGESPSHSAIRETLEVYAAELAARQKVVAHARACRAAKGESEE